MAQIGAYKTLMVMARWAIVIACVGMLTSGGSSYQAWGQQNAAAYDSAPILRLGSQVHFGAISRASQTPDGRLIATSSRDGTVILWRADTLRPLRRFRVPISRDYERDAGSVTLRSVAISPDGRFIAAGGETRSDGASRIYVFSIETGEIVATPFDARGRIAELAYAPDGALLAAGIYDRAGAESNGLWVWNTASWSVARRDRDYGDERTTGRVNALAFIGARGLITTSFDGKVRYYRDVLENRAPQAHLQSPAHHPVDAAYSENRREVVVSYWARDTHSPTIVALFSVADGLRYERAMEIGGLRDNTGRDVSATWANGVEFSASGRYLFAGLSGNVAGKDDERIRRWSLDGGPSRDFEVCSDQNVIEVLPNGEDGATFVNTDPCLTTVNGAGEVIAQTRRPDYSLSLYDELPARDTPESFLVSRNGEQIVLRDDNSRSLSFNLSALLEDAQTGDPLRVNQEAARTQLARLDGDNDQAERLRITDWIVGTDPKMNGRPLRDRDGRDGIRNESNLASNYSYSVDVANDGSFTAIGAVSSLAAYNSDNSQRWLVLTQEAVLRTNITPSGRIVVAYYQNGVTSWHDADTGDTLLSLFVDARTSSWVLWTPSGYYVASPGGDDLIGWHLNNGPDEAPYWIEGSRYNRSCEPNDRTCVNFFRPDIIRGVIAAITSGESVRTVDADAVRVSQDTTEAARLVRANAPPVARIQNVQFDTSGAEPQLLVTFQVESPSGRPVDGVRIDVNGRTYLNQTRELPTGEIIARSIPAPPGAARVTVIARSLNDESDADTFELGTRDLEAVEILNGRPAVGNLHAVVVGVNAYRNRNLTRLRSLEYAIADARAFADVLRSQASTSAFNEVHVTTLCDNGEGCDGPATRDAIERHLAQLTSAARVKPEDSVVIFLAGHGITDETGNYYFLPYGMDIQPDGQLFDYLMVSGHTLQRTVQNTPARSLLFLDTCRSFAAVNMGLANRTLNLQRETYIFTSSTEQQVSRERSSWGGGHGVFTFALLQALTSDRADQRDQLGIVDSQELSSFVQSEVINLTNRAGRAQSPQFYGRTAEGDTAAIAPLFQIVRSGGAP